MPELHDEPASRPAEPLVASREARDIRVFSFYFIVGALLLVLGAGAAYRQLIQNGAYGQTERLQQERRIIYPGPRGRILDRHGHVLAENIPQFSAVLDLAALQDQFQAEAEHIRANFRVSGERDITWGDIMQIAQVAIVKRYFDRVETLLGRHDDFDPAKLKAHLREQLLLPYTLIPNLTNEEFARMLEEFPVASPVQVVPTSVRYYPYGAAASHVLGYVAAEDNIEAEDFPGSDLMTFKMKGTVGRDGLEKEFDSELQGQAGGEIYRVSPAGYRVSPPVAVIQPRAGHDIVTSLDIDMQQAAETAIGDYTGAAVAIDVRTGEILVLASKPDYDLNQFPRDPAAVAAATKEGAWNNYADSAAGRFAPGSTFKLVVSIAGLLSGRLNPDDTSVDCEGAIRIGNRIFRCDNGYGHHGRLKLPEAIAESCDIYFWEHGLDIGPQLILAQARRFGLDQPTGIDLPGEAHGLLPDPALQRQETGAPWTAGETANISIGQGAIAVTPLEMACFAASLARGEIRTKPTLLHDPSRPEQDSEPIGLTPAQRAVLLQGMHEVTTMGTASLLSTVDLLKIPGVQIAGKTGTAQHGQGLDVAWFMCFAPLDHPEVAVAVAIQGDTPGETFGGGREAGPVAAMILKAYFAEKAGPTPSPPGSAADARIAGLP